MPGIPSKDASFVRETPRNYALTVIKCQKEVGFNRSLPVLNDKNHII